MTKRQHITLKMLVLSIVLLAGQYAALVHSVEHPFHKNTQACEKYVSLERLGHGLTYHVPVLANPQLQQLHQTELQTVAISFSYSCRRSRAPPSFL